MAAPIRIAISGGGVAGASLLRAILPLPHIDAHIFESAPKFREAGVAFGIGTNAREALKLMGEDIQACLERAGGVPMNNTIGYVAQGEDTGKEVLYIDQSTTIVQRANLLHEFLDGIPSERLHASKKLTTVDRQPDGSLLLHFADGSTHECDLLIGADGVHSTVRKIVLGEDDPAAHARNTGDWCVMTLNPYEQARSCLGSALVDTENANEQAWIGRESFQMTNILNNGQTVQYSILSSKELPLADPADSNNRWSRTVTAEWLESTYCGQGWPSNLEKSIREIICSEPTRTAIYLWEHLPAKTYVSGPICIFGDAAHATTPYMGSGGGQCMEDTMIMSTLLARVLSPAEAVKAFEVYDRIRRPRSQAVVEASRRTGELITGSDKEIGIDAVSLKKALDNRWDFIWKFSNETCRNEAIEMLDMELGKTVNDAANGVHA